MKLVLIYPRFATEVDIVFQKAMNGSLLSVQDNIKALDQMVNVNGGLDHMQCPDMLRLIAWYQIYVSAWSLMLTTTGRMLGRLLRCPCFQDSHYLMCNKSILFQDSNFKPHTHT